jgi:hypothetical protein
VPFQARESAGYSLQGKEGEPGSDEDAITGRVGAGEGEPLKSEDAVFTGDGTKREVAEKADETGTRPVFAGPFEAARKLETPNGFVGEASGAVAGGGVEVTVTAGEVSVTGGDV